MVPTQHELKSRPQVVNLIRCGVVNLDRHQVVSFVRWTVVNLTEFSTLTLIQTKRAVKNVLFRLLFLNA